MVTKARIENNVVVEVLTADPFPPFHPSLVWIDAPAGCEVGWIVDGGEVVPPPADIEPEPSFAERQTQMIRSADLIAKRKRDSIVADYSPAEMSSWPIKRAEAFAWQASGNAADATNLSVEAQTRQCTLPDLVARVIAKAAALSHMESLIAGYTGLLHDRIRSVDDGDAAGLDQIDIEAGWPV